MHEYRRERLISLLKETALNRSFVELRNFRTCIKRIEQLVEHTQRLMRTWKDLSEVINKITEVMIKQVEKHQIPSLEDEHMPELLMAERLFGESKRIRSKYSIKRTPSKAYWLPILETLSQLGGRGHAQEVLKIVFEKMKQQLTEDDLMPVHSARLLRWESIARRAHSEMTREGLLRGDSPADVWGITEAGRAYLDRVFNQKIKINSDSCWRLVK